VTFTARGVMKPPRRGFEITVEKAPAIFLFRQRRQEGTNDPKLPIMRSKKQLPQCLARHSSVARIAFSVTTHAAFAEMPRNRSFK
jgi:hypothetical protein